MQILHFPNTFDLANFLKQQTYAGQFFDHASLKTHFAAHETAKTRFYHLSQAEANYLYASANQALEMIFATLAEVIEDEATLKNMGITHPKLIELIRASWRYQQPCFYGAFDIAFDGQAAKIYEYNGNTPVMLFESCILQDALFNHYQPGLQAHLGPCQQYNEIWPQLLQSMRAQLRGRRVGFACDPALEDYLTYELLAGVAQEALVPPYGQFVDFSSIDEVGYRSDSREFFIQDPQARVDTLFLLKPWEELVDTSYFSKLDPQRHWLIEPAYKLLSANKALLAYVYQKFGHRTDLFPKTSLDVADFQGQAYVAKPWFGRMSNNIRFYNAQGEQILASEGAYANQPCVYQAYHPMPKNAQGEHFQMRVWTLADQQGDLTAAGLAIRECEHELLSLAGERFVAHAVA